jgi:uncharacterized protein (TIGR03067 family)
VVPPPRRHSRFQQECYEPCYWENGKRCGGSVGCRRRRRGYHGLAVELPAKHDKKADKPKEDKDTILGTWKVEKVEEDGKDASETDDGKRFKSKPWTITGDKIVLEGGFEMTDKLDPAAKPKAIDLDNGGGKTWDCVYSLHGDTLQIGAPLTPGDDRPKEVASKEGSKTRQLVLKRLAKDKK